MTTITEDYVSFETAKLLKEKGFNEETEYVFSNNEELLKLSHFGIKDLTNTDCDSYHNWQFPIEGVASIISALTLQMAMKWLRKVHNLCLFVIPATIDKTFRAGYALYPQCDSKWEWCASKNDRSKATFGFNINRKYCDSYEEAAEEAIKYCLENLI